MKAESQPTSPLNPSPTRPVRSTLHRAWNRDCQSWRVWYCCSLLVQFLEIMKDMVEAMDDPTCQFDEKREHRRSRICCKLRLSHLDVVFLPIEGHAQKRLAEYIAML